jgi:hypothetical protein
VDQSNADEEEFRALKQSENIIENTDVNKCSR